MNQLLEFAYEVLKKSEVPLIYQDIWKKGNELNLVKMLETSGKTPWQTVGARLFVEVRDNPDSKFIKVGKRPAKFFLKEKKHLVTDNMLFDLEKDIIKETKTDVPKYNERELHPIVSYFAYSNTQFNRGKAILTKTIFHEKSRKEGLNEWIHPDMVGVYIPIEDWSSEIIELNSLTNSNAISIYSFELKKKLDRSNYREYFFQAVSNSSWANEGYLVAAYIKEDDELLTELERLSVSFGIGIIQLDLDDIDSSQVLYHAKYKKGLDWETMNKLADLNVNFSKFLQDVKIDFESKRIHKAEYDSIIEDPEKYIIENIKKNK
jgi:hypothetical protein